MNNIINQISHWELLDIEKPARYLGGEANQAKIKANPKLRVCLVFPDLYELGMSNQAIKIFYESINNRDDVMAERCFAPWPDFEALLRRKNLPLYSLETGTALNQFDALYITLPYEMTFTNVLYILDLGGIPLLWKDRKDGPVIIAGGPSAANPMPVSKFMDAVFIGDGEESILEMCDVLISAKEAKSSISEKRKALSKISGMWVPEFPAKSVTRRVFKGFSQSAPPLHPVVPNVQATHNRAAIEIFRGCIRGCRFCNAGFYYRPKRERPVENIVKYSCEMLKNTGEETLGLLSLSTSDYSNFESLVKALQASKLYPEQTISIPSLRMNDNTIKLLDETPQIRKGGLTFAPEAGTQRLRDVINKNITEEDIINVMKTTGDSEYRTVKLYFMMGLPFEKDEDIEGIVALVKRLEEIGRSTKPKKQISISLSGFIPKPFTPFQWAGQNSIDELKRKRVMVCKGLEGSSTKISWREEYLCLLESVLARGDEKICDLILAAYQNGCKLDGWFEHFSREGWEKAFEQTGIKAEDYTRSHNISEKLPWDFIDFLTPRAFFEKEYRRAAEIAGEEVE